MLVEWCRGLGLVRRVWVWSGSDGVDGFGKNRWRSGVWKGRGRGEEIRVWEFGCGDRIV